MNFPATPLSYPRRPGPVSGQPCGRAGVGRDAVVSGWRLDAPSYLYILVPEGECCW